MLRLAEVRRFEFPHLIKNINWEEVICIDGMSEQAEVYRMNHLLPAKDRNR